MNATQPGFSKKEKCLAVVTCAIIFFSVYAQFMRGDQGDKNWGLLATQMLYDGKALYTDISCIVMPMFFWLYLIPITLANKLGITDYYMLVLVGFCLIALIMPLCMQLGRDHPAIMGDKRKAIQFFALLCLTFIVWYDAHSFMDREYILFLLTFPYVLRWMPSLAPLERSRGESLLIGFAAAIGFCIKPHSAIIFLAVQLLYCLRQRSLRILASIENIVIYTIGVSYLISIWLFYPSYFSLILPMILATYSAVSDKAQSLFYMTLTYVLMGISFVDFRLRDQSPYRKDILYFIGIALAWLVYALGNNGWYYTWAPIYIWLLFVNGWIWWEYTYLKQNCPSNTKEMRRLRQGQFACSLNMVGNVVFMIAFNSFFLFSHCDDICQKRQSLEGVMQEAHAHNFGVISIEIGLWTELSRHSGTPWLTRFCNIWMLPKFFVADDAFKQAHQSIPDYVRHAFAQDLATYKPDMVFVDDTEKFYDIYHKVDLIAYLGVDSSFRNEWAHYSYFASLDKCRVDKSGKSIKHGCKYDAYKRTP